MNDHTDVSTEALQIKRTDNDQQPEQPETHNALEAPAPLVYGDVDKHDQFPFLQSREMVLENMGVQRTNLSLSSHAGDRAGPRSSGDPGVMVEELTLKKFKSQNLSSGGSSSSGEKPSMRWHNFTRILGQPRDVTFRESNSVGRDNGVCNAFPPRFGVQIQMAQSQLETDNSKTSNLIPIGDMETVSTDEHLRSSGATQTKVFTTSGFQQLFMKNRLKGKGIAYQHQTSSDTMLNHHQCNQKNTSIQEIAVNPSHTTVKVDDMPVLGGRSEVLSSHREGISLRVWLKPKSEKISKVERMRIFKQILDLVDTCHSQGFALSNLCPSYFIMLPINQVKYIGLLTPQPELFQLSSPREQDINYLEHKSKIKRYVDYDKMTREVSTMKRQKLVDNDSIGIRSCHPSGSSRSDYLDDKSYIYTARNSGCDFRELKLDDKCKTFDTSWTPSFSISHSQQSMPELVKLEKRWYASPEELNDSSCSFSSNMYSLGVLLFELFCSFESWEVHCSAMLDLRLRVLPPTILSEYPKEASFCLWLLHPNPSSRPKSKDILISELVSENKFLPALDQSSAVIKEEDAEADLLSYFLSSLQEQKKTQAAKLIDDLECLKAEIEEVEKRHSLITESSGGKNLLKEFSGQEPSLHLEAGTAPFTSSIYEERIRMNIHQFESAYFLMQPRADRLEDNSTMRSDIDILNTRDGFYSAENNADGYKTTDSLGVFYEGLCKYARYSKFEVRGSLNNLDILNSANTICSLSFDRDQDYFAAAGVSKKIKIYEFGALLDDSVDIHYPLLEISNRSKLSCVCWNNYIKNYLASTDYEGVVQLWDASTGQGFMQLTEHQKRAWSVNFSQLDPTKLVSGSDDFSVKLWSINERSSISTIKNMANVCCVQFSPHSSHLLALGSADYKIFCYDLRNTRVPWCTLAGHGKAVSYVKFLDPETLVSASTDNSLKTWNLNKTISSGFSANACDMTLRGHTNEKNFIGLSVCDGYITCGSETNEVYAYYKTFPMPITSHKFGSLDPITAKETIDDNEQFVSSVCWRSKSNVVVAANSSGSIKVLQLL